MEDRVQLFMNEFETSPVVFMDDNIVEFTTDGDETNAVTFMVDDDKKAGWALRQYSVLEHELTRKKDLVKDEIERLKSWLELEQEKIEKRKAFLSQHLDAYLYQLRLDNPKAKIDTPYGTVTTRKSPAKFVYEDDKVIKFLHDADMTDFIRVKEEIDKTPLKKVLTVKDGRAYTEAGEEVDGIVVEDAKDVLSIKVE